MSSRTHSSAAVLFVIVCTAVACSSQPTAPSQPNTSSTGIGSQARFGDRTPGVVFVTSQGLYYDTFVVKDPLLTEGPFQKLESGQTEFGPGQPGYLGGRWWEDTNGDGVQNEGDHFFLCPLLPPGRTEP